MILFLLFIPVVLGVLAFCFRQEWCSRTLLILGAVAHLVMTLLCWKELPSPALAGWLALDEPGLLFLTIVSVLFVLASIYRIGSRTDPAKTTRDLEEGFLFQHAKEASFCGTMLFFLTTMTMCCTTQQFGLLWVAVEATTLASAPLIFFHRHRRSLEAAWKYLLICSVGIAIALLGNFFLAVATPAKGAGGSMLLAQLMEQGSRGLMDPLWLKAAFVLILVGYGTKMGLAPMHTWLPDAHSEAPSVVSALLSGALLNCAFLALLRTQQVLVAANLGSFGQEMFLLMGLISMAVAAAFIVGQTDYKRLLAYSSVEHMGILSIGIGIGGMGTFGALLHALNHSITKAMLFFAAGHILTVYRTKHALAVRGLLSCLPITGIIWVAGLFAITGSPPFGTFVSELTILSAAWKEGHPIVAILFLTFLAVAFAGMAATMLRMAQQEEGGEVPARAHEPVFVSFPLILLASLVLLFGLWLPQELVRCLSSAAAAVGGL